MSVDRLIYHSNKEEETILLGKKLGKILQSGDIVLLEGNLGTGKTLLVRGIARGMDIRENVSSPSFTLINEYGGRLSLFHMDFYRLDKRDDLVDIGFEEYLEREGVVAIEWPGLAEEFLPPETININIEIESESSRLITINGEIRNLKELLADVNTGS